MSEPTPNTPTFADRMLAGLDAFIGPLIEALADAGSTRALLGRLGWRLAELDEVADAIAGSLAAVRDEWDALAGALDTASDADAGNDSGAGGDWVSSLVQALPAVRALARAVGAFSDASVATPPPTLDQLGGELLLLLAEDCLRARLPFVWLLATSVGAFVSQRQAAQRDAIVVDGKTVRDSYRVPELHLDALADVLSDPSTALRRRYAAGGLDSQSGVQALADGVFPILADAFSALGGAARYGTDPYFELDISGDDEAILDHSLVLWMLASDEAQNDRMGLAIGLVPPASDTDGHLAIVVAPLTPGMIQTQVAGVNISAAVGDAAPFALVLGAAQLDDGASPPSLSFALHAPFDPTYAQGTDASAGTSAWSAGLSVDLTVDASGVLHLGGSIEARGVVRIAPGQDADRFVAAVLPGDGFAVPLDLSIAYGGGRIVMRGSSSSSGATTLASLPPLHLGPLAVTGGRVDIAPGSNGLSLRGVVSVLAALGPVSLTITDVGIRFIFSGAPRGGTLGPLDLDIGFAPPDGLGIAIDAPMVSGAGYLACDSATGRYAGAVALKIGNISIQGVGVLNTKNVPGGWSLVGLANVSGLNVQLGFGITLTGVGVLVGIHRTVDVQAIQALARAGGLDALMFPPDLAHNAAHAATQLETVFPAADGQYIFGPTVQLAWGGDSLVTAELAVYVELPTPVRILLLGSAHVTLPTAKAPVVDIHLDLLGVLDLSAKTIAIDMSLGHSTIAGMPLTGQAALRAGWGANPSFVLAIGGFNPHFAAPAGFPSLSRVALQIGGGNLTVRLSAYLAITSNTVQLGAQVDLRAAGGGVELTATVAFDALVQFSPFHLEVDLHIAAALKFHGAAIAGLTIDVHLTGPGPWHLAGSVQVNILFLSVTVPISGTFGAAIAAPQPSTYDPFADLVAAIGNVGNWTLEPPAGTPTLLVRQGVDRDVLHPCSAPQIRQQVLPLRLPIDRIGAHPLPRAAAYDVGLVGGLTSTPVTAPFARAQYVQLSDAEKLSSPSFDPLVAGVALPPGMATATAATVVVASTTAAVHLFDRLVSAASADTATADPPATTLELPDDLLDSQLASAAAAVNNSARVRFPGGPFGGIVVQTPTYTVRSAADASPAAAGLAATADVSAYSSYSEAAAALPGAAQVRYLSELRTAAAAAGGR